jgi:hypothetical protein
MISNETIKRGLMRALSGFVAGGLTAFALIVPSNFESLNDIRLWGIMAGYAFITGGILGLQKAITGYYKYDKEEK